MNRWVLMVGVVLASTAAGCASEDDDSTGSGAEDVTSAANRCLDPVPGTCNFYSSCLEKAKTCGPNGYALGYGAKYCARFSAEDRFSPDGTFWRDITLVCLQRSLVDFVDPKVAAVTTCDELSDEAFDSHPVCYTQPEMSVCDLPLSDWNLIRKTVDAGDILSRPGVRQVASILRRCLFGGLFSHGGADGIAAAAPRSPESAAEFEAKAALVESWEAELDASR